MEYPSSPYWLDRSIDVFLEYNSFTTNTVELRNYLQIDKKLL